MILIAPEYLQFLPARGFFSKHFSKQEFLINIYNIWIISCKSFKTTNLVIANKI